MSPNSGDSGTKKPQTTDKQKDPKSQVFQKLDDVGVCLQMTMQRKVENPANM